MNTLSILLEAKKAEAVGGGSTMYIVIGALLVVFAALFSFDKSWSNIVDGVRNSMVFEFKNKAHDLGIGLNNVDWICGATQTIPPVT